MNERTATMAAAGAQEHELLHLNALIEHLRRMQQMPISARERWAIAETLAQVYERVACLVGPEQC